MSELRFGHHSIHRLAVLSPFIGTTYLTLTFNCLCPVE
jgi:hypothetical protein